MRIQKAAPLTLEPVILQAQGSKIAIMLLLASLLASCASFPLQYRLTSQLAAAANQSLPEFPVMMTSSVLISLFISLFCIALGLACTPQAGLGPLLLHHLMRKSITVPRIKSIVLTSIVIGTILGIVLVIFSLLAERTIPIKPPVTERPALWLYLLASIGAAINEEIWLRLGVMTLLVCLAQKIPGISEHPSAIWIGNAVAAIVFGLIHLPQANNLVGLSPAVVSTVLLLNGLGGLTYGWVYWRYGLLMAMLTHFTTDMVLHIVTPVLI